MKLTPVILVAGFIIQRRPQPAIRNCAGARFGGRCCCMPSQPRNSGTSHGFHQNTLYWSPCSC
jgi:hypothetical protein